ncbi:FAD binding domain-containing protein [Halomicrobium zhouii]|uniref:FAD binding domain-containing protein n=1 Tax=Halomicrobium zhouii TaxID=767519 RepID=A0A1I6LI94_9EURY|nr:FAD-dependent oxidoreductase [Halomicrobium zhouii]SFS03083.1 FAD binding domain-containing protein [Halomicrobium zhouii]
MASDPADPPRTVVVGGGVAGLSAALFTARAGLPTRVVSAGEPILARNAHLENYPGFPAGINARLLLEMTRDQVEAAGAAFVDGTAVDVTPVDDDSEDEMRPDGDGGSNGDDGTAFTVSLEDGRELSADSVVAASWSDAAYLDDLDLGLIDRGSKRYVDVDEFGRSAVDGIYAAGRLAGTYHQAIVAAGHGATVGRTVVEDSDVPFYNDWVAPEGYFTGRGREVPPGCEEIDEAEWQRRAERSAETMREYFEDPAVEPPTMHPSVDHDE